MFKWASQTKTINYAKDIFSPDGNIRLHFELVDGQLLYSVYKDQKTLIWPSHLGFFISGEDPLYENLILIREKSQAHDETIELPWGEDRLIINNYHESTFFLGEKSAPGRILTLQFRVFDTGVAFRYCLPAQPKFRQITIKDELTEFHVDENSTAWKIPAFLPNRYEYDYKKCVVSELDHAVHTPLTIHTPTGYYLAIHEAALYNYGSMALRLDGSGALKSSITPLSDHTKAHVKLPFETPWRLIMIADSSIDLTMNRLIYALNEAPSQDFSWVKPLKFIGIWWAMYVGEWTWAEGEKHGATTDHAREYIDAAVRLGISGLLIEGWNQGWEGDWLENGIHNNFIASTPDFNLDVVSAYAAKHHVELIAHNETVGFIDNYEAQMDQAYQYYQSHHIHYLKTGYAGRMMTINGREEYHHSQVGVNHYQKTVELAAKYHLCLDIHEPIKGTGIERTWPNLLSREGARGQEYEGGTLSPSHACYLPFTRLLAGGMDYTSGIFDLRNNVKKISTTLARQLAYYVTIYSGMVMAADRPFIYEERFPEAFSFIHDVPVNFARTLTLAGEVGEYYVVARQARESKDWFVGGITNESARQIIVTLEFLEHGTYAAEIYADADDADYRTNPFAMTIRQEIVTREQNLKIRLAPGGGFAIRLKKRLDI